MGALFPLCTCLLFRFFFQQLQNFKDRRLLSVFLFGISSGFPWVMIGSSMSAWLKDEDLSRSAIGFFGSIFVAYSINFLWSPLLDRIKLPWLGLRRGWIITLQALLALTCSALALIEIQNQLFLAALFGFAIAVLSATQDIAIDGYRIDIIGEDEKEKLSAASAMATSGWWTGFGGLGAIPFFIADIPGWSWPEIYLVLAAIMALLMLPVLMADEPVTNREQLQEATQQRYLKLLEDNPKQGVQHTLKKLTSWLAVTLVEPFGEFFRRNGVKLALSLLLFIFMFKMGEAFLGRMSVVFYKEIGFTNTDIGTISKLLNWWITIFFAVIGGMVNMRFGIYKGLMIAGIAMAASNLMFALMAQVGPDKALFAATVFVDGFTGAWSSVAMVALISLFCSRAFSATQYALMASLGVLGRTVLASSSGFIVDSMNGDWTFFFILTALMVLPSLGFLYLIRHDIKRMESKPD